MQLTNPIEFLKLGARIRYLAGVTTKHKLGGYNYVLDNLKWLKSSLDELGFVVSQNLFQNRLAPYIQTFEQMISKSTDEIVLLGEHAKQFSHDILNFEKTVDAEALTRRIALPVPRRIPLDHLLDDPSKNLGSGVYDELSNIAREDLLQACRCIAFECSTAAAFHILRCTEECVRILYSAYFPRRKLDKQSWGQLITELRQKHRKPKPDATLLIHLNHLRERFRNPTDHPDKCYEVEEAEDLLHVAIDAINRCMRDPKVRG